MKKDNLAAERYAGKHGDLFAVRASAFLAGVRYGRRTAVEVVKALDKKRNSDTETYAYIREVTVEKAVKAIKQRGRS